MNRSVRFVMVAAGTILFVSLIPNGHIVLVMSLRGTVDSAASPALQWFWRILYLAGFFLMYGIPSAFLWLVATGRKVGKAICILVVAEAISLAFLWPIRGLSPRRCTSCDFIVGGVDLSVKPMTVDELIREFGRGCESNVATWLAARQYYFPKAQATMLISSTQIKLSRGVGSSQGCKATKELKMPGTSKGVNLGDPLKKVIAVYGEPDDRHSDPSTLHYFTPGKLMVFELVEAHVDSILVQVGE